MAKHFTPPLTPELNSRLNLNFICQGNNESTPGLPFYYKKHCTENGNGRRGGGGVSSTLKIESMFFILNLPKYN